MINLRSALVVDHRGENRQRNKTTANRKIRNIGIVRIKP